MKIGFVFTNYNNTLHTRNALNSIYSIDWSVEPDVVIVDNNSLRDELELLRIVQNDYPKASYIYNCTNDGYFEGLNIGISALPSKHDYFCVVIGNNDLIFNKNFEECLMLLSDVLMSYPVIAPDILTLDGVHQNPHLISGPSFVRNLIWDAYYSSYALARVMSFFAGVTKKFTERKDYMAWELPQEIMQGYGACYILGPLFFLNFEKLWAPTFLMGEEYFLWYQLKSKKYKVFYDPRVRVNHVDHASTGKLPSRKIWEYGKISHLECKKLSK